MAKDSRCSFVLVTLLLGALVPGVAGAVEPPACGEEEIWPDISGFYAVTGSCGDAWCPQMMELQRWEGAHCRFDIIDGDPSCSSVDVDEQGDVSNPVSYAFCASSLECSMNGPELPDGSFQFEGCRWVDYDAGTSVPCDPLLLVPTEGPLPVDNHLCRLAGGSSGGTAGETGGADATGGADEASGTGGADDTGPPGAGTSSASVGDADSEGGGTTGSPPADDMGDAGCGCRSTPRSGMAALGLLGLLLWRRRR